MKAKRICKLKIIILMIALANVACYHQKEGKQDAGNDLMLIEQMIHNCIGWAKTKDLSLLYSVIANDTAFLEVHPNDNFVHGIAEFKKAEKFWMHNDFKAINYEIRDLNIHISESGTVAWWFCMLDDINEWKGQPANWENTRWTGVCEKRNGNWVVVQQHFSFAAE